MKPVNQVKDEIQRQAHAVWVAAGRVGTVVAGTGFGKSRLAVMEIKRLYEDVGELRHMNLHDESAVLLVTPTEKLRDENWPKEFTDWGEEHLLGFVKSICFASLKKELGSNHHYKLVILDEIHRLTELSAQAFKETGNNPLTSLLASNLADAVMGLTATVPDPKRDPDKAAIINQIAPVVFRYTLDQGVNDGMIRDYEIRVIQTILDDRKKCIPGGTKDKPFLTTEAKHYEYLEKQIKKWRMLANKEPVPAKKAKLDNLAMYATMARNRFLYNCETKTDLAARCIRQIQAGKRTLVFCGSIEQANKLLGEKVYHSKSSNEAYTAFNQKAIDILGVVNAANEGVNFTDLDQSLVIQVDSNERNLVQRTGRNLRLGLSGKAIIYILVVQNTADERWLEKSLVGFDPEKVKYYSAKSVPL